MTKEAGKLAGLQIFRLADKPTAAAVAYSLVQVDRHESNILVYSMGGSRFGIGGSFEPSTISIANFK